MLKYVHTYVYVDNNVDGVFTVSVKKCWSVQVHLVVYACLQIKAKTYHPIHPTLYTILAHILTADALFSCTALLIHIVMSKLGNNLT